MEHLLFSRFVGMQFITEGRFIDHGEDKKGLINLRVDLLRLKLDI